MFILIFQYIISLTHGLTQVEFPQSMAAKGIPEAFRGKNITVAVYGVPPYIVYNGDSIRGTEMDVLKVLQEKIGFNVKIQRDKGWIYIENGTLKGLPVSLSKKEADIAVGNLGIMVEINFPGKNSKTIYRVPVWIYCLDVKGMNRFLLL